MRGYVEPHQQRSRVVVERVLATVDQLIEHRPFPELTVLEICNEADVSMSSLYARFRTKDDILSALFDRHVGEARVASDEALQAALVDGADIERVTVVVLTSFAQFIRRHGALMRSIFAVGSLNEQYWRLSTEVLDSLTALATGAYGRDDAEFIRAVNLGARIASSSLQRALGVPMNFGERIGFTDEELVTELAAMLVAYWDRFVACS